MSTVHGHLNNFLRFSAVDGPGNRFVIFLQGCNFDCVVCHNPYTINNCNGCGLCVGRCPEAALATCGESVVELDRALCTDCDVCIEVCPYDATPLSRWVGVDELLDEIRRTASFITGITVSGGEATLQWEFLIELFGAIKRDPELAHLTTFVDSNGAAPQQVWEELLPVMDGAMIDLKALDDATHRALTGQPNAQVLDSIRFLAGRRRLYEVRMLIIPGRNDDPATVAAAGDWLRAIDPEMRIKVIGYRRHGVRPVAALIDEPSPQHLDQVADLVGAGGPAEIVVV